MIANAETLGILARSGFLHGSLRRRLKKRVYASPYLGVKFYYAMYTKERASLDTELRIAKLAGEMALSYAQDVLGMGDKCAYYWEEYCQWKMGELAWAGQASSFMREMDAQYAHLYPDSKFHGW